MRIAWKEEKNTFGRSWLGYIGPCLLHLSEGSPFDREFWTRNHRKGEELYEYWIIYYPSFSNPSESRELDRGAISLPREDADYHAQNAQAALVKIARRFPECKRARRVLEAPPAEMVEALRIFVLALIRDYYAMWRRQRDDWAKDPNNAQAIQCASPPSFSTTWTKARLRSGS